MPYSIINVVGNGSQVTWPINFTLGIIDRENVKCRVGDEVDGLNQPLYRDLTWITDGLVTVQGAPAGNLVPVQFIRTVDKEELIHDYTNGVAIEEANLDETAKQSMMAIHEILDGRIAPLVDNLDVGGNRVTNMADGTEPDDAVTLSQLEDMTGNSPVYAAAAAASAAEAETHKDDAEAAEAGAIAQALVALGYANDANTAKLAAEAAAAGMKWRDPVDAATTTTLPACTYSNGTSGVGATLTGNANGALAAQDGITLTANQLLLVKNQASALQNGVYKLTQVGSAGTPFILTRQTDADSWTELQSQVRIVQQGTVNADETRTTIWICTANAGGTIGTTSVNWADITFTIANGSLTVAMLASSAYATQAEAQALAESTKLITSQRVGQSLAFAFANKVLSGLTLSTSGSDATNDVVIAAGTCASDDGTTIMQISSAITKQVDAAWSVGNNAGGLDTGAVGNNSYYVWVINRPDTGVTDVLFSTSATAPTMPTNYTKKKLIGGFNRVSSSNVANEFNQNGKFRTQNRTVTTGGTTTVAHCLGGVPDRFFVYVVCVTAQGIWAVGDRFLLAAFNNAANNPTNGTGGANATNVFSIITGNGLYNGGALTDANFKLVLVAEKD